jgi:hypothetical protein
MTSTQALPSVTSRDFEVLAALDRSRLTAEQLLKLSETFTLPFTTERRVRERLQTLCDCGRVRRSQYYATAGRGAQTYYTLTRVGYRLLYGDEATPPTKRYFGDIGVANHHHTRCLADFIVHTAVSAHRSGLTLANFCRENTLRLEIGEQYLYPDCAFQLVTADGRAFSYFVELDNGSERVESDKPIDSWERKIRLYEICQDHCPERFRVLIVTTRRPERLDHILNAAARLTRNTQRSLFYGICLPQYLSADFALTAACFLNHRDQPVSLIPAQSSPHAPREESGISAPPVSPIGVPLAEQAAYAV